MEVEEEVDFHSYKNVGKASYRKTNRGTHFFTKKTLYTYLDLEDSKIIDWEDQWSIKKFFRSVFKTTFHTNKKLGFNEIGYKEYIVVHFDLDDFTNEDPENPNMRDAGTDRLWEDVVKKIYEYINSYVKATNLQMVCLRRDIGILVFFFYNTC